MVGKFAKVKYDIEEYITNFIPIINIMKKNTFVLPTTLIDFTFLYKAQYLNNIK